MKLRAFPMKEVISDASLVRCFVNGPDPSLRVLHEQTNMLRAQHYQPVCEKEQIAAEITDPMLRQVFTKFTPLPKQSEVLAAPMGPILLPLEEPTLKKTAVDMLVEKLTQPDQSLTESRCLSQYTLTDLRTACVRLQLNSTGTKVQLEKRLFDYKNPQIN
jgi:hypothetical protein